jgi:hypothetical protein
MDFQTRTLTVRRLMMSDSSRNGMWLSLAGSDPGISSGFN